MRLLLLINLIVGQTFAEVSGAASAESLPWSDSFETAELVHGH